MRISIEEAAGRLEELADLVEAGEEVILTEDGRAAVRLVPALSTEQRAGRREAIEDVRAAATSRPPAPGPSAARSQDFLYQDDGLTG